MSLSLFFDGMFVEEYGKGFMNNYCLVNYGKHI